MKHKLTIFLLCVFGLFPSSAFAANWVQVGPTPADYSLYYDSTSISHDGTTAALLSLSNFAAPQYNKDIAGGATGYNSTTNMLVFDCSSHEISRIGQFAFYSGQWGNGDVITKADGYDDERRTIHSGTANEAMYNVACGN
jgi:Surface-adhesin protein E